MNENNCIARVSITYVSYSQPAWRLHSESIEINWQSPSPPVWSLTLQTRCKCLIVAWYPQLGHESWHHMASISLGTSIFSSSQPPATKVKVAPPALFIWRAAFVRHPGVPAIGRNSAEFSWGQQHLLKTCAAEGLFPWDPGVLELRWWEKSGRCYPEKSENFKRLVPGSLYCRTKLCWHKVLRVGYHKGGTEVLKKVSDCKGRLVSGAVILSHFFKCRLQVNFTPFPSPCGLPLARLPSIKAHL